MSEKKSIGKIGQMYEDRKTKKTGKLVECADNSMIFEALDGSQFSITVGSFKSNWRKCKVEESTDNAETEANTKTEADTSTTKKVKKTAKKTPEVEESTPKKEYENLTDAEALQRLLDTVNKTRQIETVVINDATEIKIDGITVFQIAKNDYGYALCMLPDIFTFSDWTSIDTESIQFKFGAVKGLGVSFNSKSTLSEVYQTIVEACVDINLYGYIDEDEESEVDE